MGALDDCAGTEQFSKVVADDISIAISNVFLAVLLWMSSGHKVL
jgi:hypothetical protein